MTGIFHDFRYALRTMRKTPGFTAVIVLSLALGIGATTAIFTLANAYLLRPLPVNQPDRLVAAYLTSPAWEGTASFSYPDLEDYRKTGGLSDLMGHTGISLSITEGEKPELIWGEVVTDRYFSGLRIKPVLGRGFLPEEEQKPGRAVAVISYNFWRRRFQSDPGVVGRTLEINHQKLNIVGVAPRGFIGTQLFQFVPDLWLPVAITPLIAPRGDNYLEARNIRWISLRGRLKPGVTMAQAEAELNGVARALSQLYPQTHRGHRVHLIPGSTRTQPYFVAKGIISLTTAIMTGLVAFVLLIACTNVASLMLARGSSRVREFAIRLATGASRTRLFRQLLVESFVLALAGAVVGIGLAFFFSDALRGFYPVLDFTTVDMDYDMQPDRRIFLFALAVSALTAVLFGLVPAIRATRVDPAAAMKSDAAIAATGGKPSASGYLLTAAQVAVSSVLLVAGGLFLRSMQQAHRTDPGFNTSGILLYSVNLDLHGYDTKRGSAFFQRLQERMSALPGVTSASLSWPLPLDAYDNTVNIHPEGYVPRSADESRVTGTVRVGPRYFETIGTALVAGRGFTERDDPSAPRVAIVNETLARRYWGSTGNALGRRFKTSTRADAPWIEIAGVARDGKYVFLGEAPMPFVFFPLAQRYPGLATVILRSDADPARLMAAVRAAVRSLDATLPVYGVKTMPQFLSRTLSTFELGAAMIGAFAAIALLLAAAGLCGLMHFSVTRRIREIGIRVALGARIGDVLRAMLARAFVATAAGLAVGLTASVAVTRLMQSLLLNVTPYDPATLAAVAAITLVTAIAAGLWPAHRAASVHPIEALHHD